MMVSNIQFQISNLLIIAVKMIFCMQLQRVSLNQNTVLKARKLQILHPMGYCYYGLLQTRRHVPTREGGHKVKVGGTVSLHFQNRSGAYVGLASILQANCITVCRRRASNGTASGGDPGGQRTPHFPEWGVTYKAVTPSFDAMLMSLFSLYMLVMDGDGCR